MTVWRHFVLSDQASAREALNGVLTKAIVPEPPPESNPTDPSPELPSSSIVGQSGEQYEDYGSGSNHRMLSILNFQETLEYFMTRVRPMADLVQYLTVNQLLVATLVKSPLSLKITDAITVLDESIVEALRPSNVSVAVVQEISFTKESTRLLTESLNFQEYLTAYKVSNQWINPGVGLPSSATTLKLSWDTTNLELRNPKLGDTSSYEAVRIERNTRGNDLIVYRDTMWPDKEVLHFEFEYLTVDQAMGLLDFLHLSLGHVIQLVDQYNRTWNGHIITPESEVVQSKRVGYEAKFDFQGVLT